MQDHKKRPTHFIITFPFNTANITTLGEKQKTLNFQERQNLIKLVSAQVVKGVPFCIRFPCSLHRYRRLLRQVFFIIPKFILTLVRRYRSYVGYFRVYQGLSEWIWNPYYGSLFRSLPVLFTDIFSFGKSEKTSGAILFSKKNFQFSTFPILAASNQLVQRPIDWFPKFQWYCDQRPFCQENEKWVWAERCFALQDICDRPQIGSEIGSKERRGVDWANFYFKIKFKF